MEVQYSYYISSLEKDWRVGGILKELTDILPRLNDCEVDAFPISFPDDQAPY